MNIKHLLLSILALFGMLLSSNAADSNIIFVKVGGTGDGSSWEKAIGSVESAIALTSDGCNKTIWVAIGEYQMTKRMMVPTTVSLYGGFTGTENSVVERNYSNKSTLIGGAFTTLTASAMSDDLGTAVIDGFIFTGSALETLETGINGNIELFDNRILSNCIIAHNKVMKTAGIFTNGKATVINCLIYDNFTINSSGCCCMKDNGKMINCTIANNYGGSNSWGGLRLSGTKAYIYNTIIWGNTKEKSSTDNEKIAYQVRCDKDGYGQFSNCAIQGALTGGDVSYKTPGSMTAFIDLNSDNDNATGPKFVDPANGDFRLKEGSILLNAGNNSFAENVETDLVGNPRINNTTIDLGAYEFKPLSSLQLTKSGIVSCYPNPVEDILYIQGEQAKTIEVFNAAGSLLLKRNIPTNGQINLSTLASGIYTARIYTINGVHISTIVKK